MPTWPTDSADILRTELTTGLMRGEAREEVVDRLRVKVRADVKAATTEAGFGSTARRQRRSHARARRVWIPARSLVDLSPDVDALHLLAYALLAAGWNADALAVFDRVRAQSTDRLYADAGALGLSLALSVQGATQDAIQWCNLAIRSPFPQVAPHAALSLLVQGARSANLAATRRGVDASFDMLTHTALDTTAGLLARYIDGEQRARDQATLDTLRWAGPVGASIASRVEEIIR